MSEWTEVAWFDPPEGSVDRRAQIDTALDDFLTQRGLNRSQIEDNDIQIRVTYMGPGKGCGTHVLIRTASIPPPPPPENDLAAH